MKKNIMHKVVLVLLGLVIVVFYDTTIPLINGIIQLKFNFLGFFLEPMLQRAFDVSLREAQILAAWIYLLIASLIFWYFYRKFYQFLLAAFHSAQRSWLAINRWQKMGLILLAIILFIVIGKVGLMFF